MFPALPSFTTRPPAVSVLPVPALRVSYVCVAAVPTGSYSVPDTTGATPEPVVPLYPRVSLCALAVNGAGVITPVVLLTSVTA